jgi:hypothetical protein
MKASLTNYNAHGRNSLQKSFKTNVGFKIGNKIFGGGEGVQTHDVRSPSPNANC